MKLNQWQCVYAMRNREDFEGANLKGVRNPCLWPSKNTLDFKHREQLGADFKEGIVSYWVLSYGNPIYWETTTGGHHTVAQRFSPTTYRHQSLVSMSIKEAKAPIHTDRTTVL